MRSYTQIVSWLAIAAALCAVACGDDAIGTEADGVTEGGGQYTPPPFGLGATSTAIVVPEIIVAPQAADPPDDPRCGDGVLGEAELCDPSLHPCCNDRCDGVVDLGEVCRSADGECDAPELCDGESFLCPEDDQQPEGTACRPSAGACDVAEVCDGESIACPSDAFVERGEVCREAEGLCDVAERCTGEDAACPADAVVPASEEVVCRAADGDLACDAVERCDGERKTCPANEPLPEGTQCQTSLGTCDAAEVCDGESFECPPPTGSAAPAGTVCRIATGLCDVAEECNGRSITCPPDGFRPSTFECRADSGLGCDVAERCTGEDAACPPNGFRTEGAQCRAAAAGGCDLAESCPGDGAACPADRFAQGTVCRAAVAGGCDVEERCDGSGAICPVDAVEPRGTTCRPAAAGGCDVAETCSGASNTCPVDAFVARGTICRAAADGDLCDAAESCSGASAMCPPNGRIPEDGACNGGRGQCSMDVCCPGDTVNDGDDRCGILGDNLVFVTSMSVDGSLPGIDAADQLCNSLAASANLSSTFHAWISTNNPALPAPMPVHALTRVSNGPYVLVSGATFSGSLDELVSGGGPLAPLDRTEWNEVRDVPVWTGTHSRGVFDQNDCAMWSRAVDALGDIGQSGLLSSGWTDSGTRACSLTAALYCFQDDCPGIPNVNFMNDPNNCGACGNVCEVRCLRGVCTDATP